MKINVGLLFIIVGLLLGSCSQLTPAGQNPGWITKLIAQYGGEPVGNPPQTIWQYEYQGQIVYYIPPQCCDQFSNLFDAGGKLLCAPDGGFTGQGDGHCPDFPSTRQNEKLVWKDPRTQN